MITAKRRGTAPHTSRPKTPANNENLLALAHSHAPHPNTFLPLHPTNKKQPSRSALAELPPYPNAPAPPTKQQPSAGKPIHFTSQDGRHSPNHRYRQHDILFVRLAELIKHEEVCTPVSHRSKPRAVLHIKERPCTSSVISRRRMSLDGSLLKGAGQVLIGPFGQAGQVVLDLTPDEHPPQDNADPSKMSTSRALMHFSKVFRNGSGDRFKVRRQRQQHQPFSLICAQKVVLQQKEKKESSKVLVESFRQNTRFRRPSVQPDRPRHRYVEQQFEIEGWDYFQ